MDELNARWQTDLVSRFHGNPVFEKLTDNHHVSIAILNQKSSALNSVLFGEMTNCFFQSEQVIISSISFSL